MIINEDTYGKATVRIEEAASHLATASGNLRERFPQAFFLFSRAGSAMPTEQMSHLHEEIHECLRDVKHGDYSLVSDDKLRRAAEIIIDLYKLSIIADRCRQE